MDPETELQIERVLGGGPFCEIGRPRVAVLSPAGDLVAAGGEFDRPRWVGGDVSRRSRPEAGWDSIAVYRSDDLACIHRFASRWPPNSIAFHPVLPLVAIGTGTYDGGWAYEGELLLLNLSTGDIVSLLEDSREVRRITWRDPQTLDLVLAVPCSEDESRFGTTSLACSIRQERWDLAVDSMLRTPYGEEPVPDESGPDPAATAAVVAQLGQERGQEWGLRRAVWAVQPLANGRILAALEGVGLECWSHAGGDWLWRVPTDGTGYQIRIRSDGRSAVVLTQTPTRRERTGWVIDPSVLIEVDLADGVIRTTREAPFPAVMTSGADGWWALRDTTHGTRKATELVLRTATDEPSARVRLGRYNANHHLFDIRYAPELILLQGPEKTPGRDTWVMTVDGPDRTMRRLFPLQWDASDDGQLFGGCGVYLEDRVGSALVHTGAVHHGAGPPTGNSFVVRRAWPSGQIQWVFTADDQATALDAGNGLVQVIFNSGQLVVLRAEDGAVITRREVRVDGHPVVPLSLTGAGEGRLIIGTLDGRVLECTI